MKLRKLISLLLCAAVLLGVFPLCISASDVTREQAIEWVKAQLGKKIDVDGVYGAQCAELIMAYYEFLGETRSHGNGSDYATEKYPLPEGWRRVYHGEPEPGDILVYTGTASNPYGHVAIYESDYSHYHQNVNNSSAVVQCDWYYSDSFNVMEYWGIIKPVFAGDENNSSGDEGETEYELQTLSGDTDSELLIRLDPNGGHIDDDYITVTLGDPIGELPAPEREGYTFLNWIYPTLFGVASVSEADTADTFNAFDGQTFYAVWSKLSTLSFETNGGSEILPLSIGGGLSLDGIEPQKDGFIFGGWYSDSALTSPITSVVSGSDITVYARWIGISFNSSDWAKEELTAAARASLIPDALAQSDMRTDITRAQFAAVAVKLYENAAGQSLPAPFSNPFGDTSDLDVLKAYEAGIVVGIAEGVFAPDTLITREQAAVILTRVYTAVSGESIAFSPTTLFADDDEISDYARESVYFMASKGIIKGVGNNMFAPKNTTAEQLAVGYANTTIEQSLLISVRMSGLM